MKTEKWEDLIWSLNLGGTTKELIKSAVLISLNIKKGIIKIKIPKRYSNLFSNRIYMELQNKLTLHFHKVIHLDITT